MNIQSISHDATVYIYDSIESYLTNVFLLNMNRRYLLLIPFVDQRVWNPF